MRFIISVLFLIVAFFPVAVYAYVGPGLGLGVIGTVLGVLVSIFLALLAIFWYPLKRIFGKGQKKKEKYETD